MPRELSGHSAGEQDAGSQSQRMEYGTATDRGVRARLNAAEQRIRARSNGNLTANDDSTNDHNEDQE